ncbi:MAG: hypothetical protein KGJ86_11760 [Chloroflexota bacterium]|nr:hypothetical protein [Chloroflexota bacterium]
MVAIFLTLLVAGCGTNFMFLAVAMNVAQAAVSEAAITGAEASTNFDNGDIELGHLSSSQTSVGLPANGSGDPDSQAAARASHLLGPLISIFQSPQITLTREVQVDGNQITGDYRTRLTGAVRMIMPVPGLQAVNIVVGAEQRYRPAAIQRVS